MSTGPIPRARAALAARRYAEAHAACMEALRADPNDAEAFSVLGTIALDNRTFDKAAELFVRAASLAPDARRWADAARAFHGLNRRPETAQAAERALAAGPSDAATLDILGVVFSRLDDHRRSYDCFERAVALRPRDPSLRLNLSWEQQFLGDLSGAEATLRGAVRLDPDFDAGWAALAELKRQTPDDNVAADLERLFAGGSLDAERRLRVGHALAKTYEDLGEFPKALERLAAAKGPMRVGAPFDFGAAERAFEAAAACRPPARAGDGPPGPVFVCGLPRSGTTVVDRILSSHPALVSAGEPMTFPLILRRALGAAAGALFDESTFRKAAAADLGEIGARYVAETRPPGAAGMGFIDKTPLDFLFAGAIARALPDARIILLRRHPVDSCLSLYRRMFAPSFEYYRFSYDLAATGRYYLLFDRLARTWAERLPPERFTQVAYEDMVADQEALSRRLVAFCGLPWDEACLRFHENAAPVASASAAQVRQPLYATSVGRWTRYGEGLKPLIDVLEAGGVLLPAI